MTEVERRKINNRNNFLNNYSNLILSVLLLLAIVLAYFFLLGPKFHNTQDAIKDNLKNQKLLLDQQKRKLSTLESINAVYGQIPASDLNRFNSVLPYKYKKERLFGEFEEIVASNNWLLQEVSVIDPEQVEEGVSERNTKESTIYGSANPKVHNLEVSLIVEGIDYLGVKKLLSILEKNIRLLDVNSVSFTESDQAEINLTTYYYQDQEININLDTKTD